MEIINNFNYKNEKPPIDTGCSAINVCLFHNGWNTNAITVQYFFEIYIYNECDVGFQNEKYYPQRNM